MNLIIDSQEKKDLESKLEIENTPTTIATIAIRAEPHTTIVIAMLKVK